MFYSLIILIYYHHHLLLHISASSLLFTLHDVRYTLSDRVLTIPKLGSIRGIHIDYENEYYKKYNLVNIEAFHGIQYGLYHGRFEPSKERFDLHPDTNVNKQIEYGAACSQYIWRNESELSRVRTKDFAEKYYPKLLKYILKQDEEQCLYMNIYQPQIKDLKERLPVLLFVHGDGYDMSTGAAFDGAIFASYTKSVVVTINYRLGPFGFLYVSRENKGDYALQDIYTALHWLKNYVTNFNGDPDRITLYGTGTGAVLASLVVMLETVNGGTGTIKRRKSLVHRLILNEQTFLSPHMTSTLQEISSYQSNFLSYLSCSTLQCLRNQTLITTDDFLQKTTYSNENGYFNYMCPLENPFPFYHSSILNNDYINPLRLRFFQQAHTLLPENLRILTLQCLRNQTLITTDDFLQKTTYSKENGYFNYMCPLENPFPFYHSSILNNDYINPLRLRFFQQAHTLLPENLRILLTTSSSITRSTLSVPFDIKNLNMNKTIEYLFNYAYTIWNKTTNKFHFDKQLLSYQQQIIAPLLEYAKYISNERKIHILERHSNKYQSELPFTFGYVLAPSMSVYNDTYLTADENDRNESMSMMDLFANLIHNGDINVKSPYCKRSNCEILEEWQPVFPELNFIILKDDKLTQQSGHYAQVHYLFNNLISNLSHRPFHIDLLNTWRSLYDMSYQHNISTQRSSLIRSSLLTKPIYNENKNLKYIFIITLSVLLILIINFLICILLGRRGHYYRKREYNCLNGHTQLNIEKTEQHHGGSSPSSTNSNGTLVQQLIVNTNCTTTTNSSLSSTPPVDILHPINVTKKNGILRSSPKQKKPSELPEAIGQSYLGEHLKRSLSTSDINNSSAKNFANPPATLHEESEEDSEFSSRLKEDRKYLSKGTTRKPLANYQEKPDDSSDNPLDEYEMSKVMARKGRTINKSNSSESSHSEIITKRQVKQIATKRSAVKPTVTIEHDMNSSNDTDDEVENMRKRT
ncbi:unnamed protein product [Adineta steineri]|uniref:Carboxylesterase type B domain-containing protein n=2 Tax=Adineta steineri TaxID=433720 RepID=A0A814M928_9BILA|nr:unnamed protein product [Adineta steineri]